MHLLGSVECHNGRANVLEVGIATLSTNQKESWRMFSFYSHGVSSLNEEAQKVNCRGARPRIQRAAFINSALLPTLFQRLNKN
eukprot:1126453-Pelagomonas_calceolata.AAC.2